MDLALYFDRMDRYAEGDMPAAERKDFEEELASNAELREAYETYLLGNEAIEQGIENGLRQQLRAWAAEDAPALTATLGGANPAARPTAKVVAMRPNWTRWAVAASVALLVGFMLFRWSAGGAASDEALFAAHYALPEVPALRSGEGAASPLEAGYRLVQSGDFAAAADFFQGVPLGNERYAEAQLWLGHAALQLKQHDRAIAAFGKAAQRNDFKIKEKAQWNLALAYLAAGRTNDAAFRQNLQEMAANPQHSYAERARALREALGDR
jgi:tetratricopeptide (TPR) repeat protein